MASPLAPVLPIISSTFAGVANEKLSAPLTPSSCCSFCGLLFTWPLDSSFRCGLRSCAILLLHPVRNLLYQLLCFAFYNNCNASCRNIYSCCRSKLFFAWHLHARNVLFLRNKWNVHCYLRRIHVFCNGDKLCLSLFKGFCSLVCAFP